MEEKNKSGFLGNMAQQIKRIARALREKPEVKLDDYVLEHFKLYHGLIGSTEDNQPKFRNVRRDILDALQNRNSAEVAIALKLPPLSWQEKLAQIFTDAKDDFGPTVFQDCLIPTVDPVEMVPEKVPLRHPDWRVRANAAKIIATLDLKDAVSQLVQALNDDADEGRPAFLYIAYALSMLKGSEARLALVQHLKSDEQWFRVDAAAALSRWPLSEVNVDLMAAVLQPNLLNDYIAVVIAREHAPKELFATSDKSLLQGALEVVIGLVEGANGPFANEAGRDMGLIEVMAPTAKLAVEDPTPRAMRAGFMLSDWVLQNADNLRVGADERQVDQSLQVASETAENLEDSKSTQLVLKWLEADTKDGSASELKHILYLAARLQIVEAATFLLPLLEPGHVAINEVLDAVGALKLVDAAPDVVAVINQVVDLTDRTSRVLSKQPVFEDDVAGTKTYWHGLRALGALPGVESAGCLLQASRDFAADKRQQALTSLIQIAQAPQLSQLRSAVETAIEQSLTDPSSQVRAIGLKGIGALGLTGLLKQAAHLAGAKEPAVSREAIACLRVLAASGQAEAVIAASTSELSGERDQYRRQRLEALIASISG